MTALYLSNLPASPLGSNILQLQTIFDSANTVTVSVLIFTATIIKNYQEHQIIVNNNNTQFENNIFLIFKLHWEDGIWLKKKKL